MIQHNLIQASLVQPISSQISVVIPVYNRPLQIVDAIESVVRQTEPPGELIVVDDASTDCTRQAVKTWIKERSARFIKTQVTLFIQDKNKGVSAARNIGVKKAAGKWIAFLDSDDVWKKKKLAKQLGFLTENPDCRWLHCDERWVRHGSHLNQKKIHQKEGTYANPKSNLLARCLKACLISPSAVVLERSLLEECGGFDEGFVVCEDFDLWLRLLPRNPLGFVPLELVEKRGGHEDQLSRQYHSMDWWRLRALKKSKEMLIPLVREQFHLVFEEKLDILRQGFLKRQAHAKITELNAEFSHLNLG